MEAGWGEEGANGSQIRWHYHGSASRIRCHIKVGIRDPSPMDVSSPKLVAQTVGVAASVNTTAIVDSLMYASGCQPQEAQSGKMGARVCMEQAHSTEQWLVLGGGPVGWLYSARQSGARTMYHGASKRAFFQTKMRRTTIAPHSSSVTTACTSHQPIGPKALRPRWA